MVVSRAYRFTFDLKLNAVPRGLNNSYGSQPILKKSLTCIPHSLWALVHPCEPTLYNRPLGIRFLWIVSVDRIAGFPLLERRDHLENYTKTRASRVLLCYIVAIPFENIRHRPPFAIHECAISIASLSLFLSFLCLSNFDL